MSRSKKRVFISGVVAGPNRTPEIVQYFLVNTYFYKVLFLEKDSLSSSNLLSKVVGYIVESILEYFYIIFCDIYFVTHLTKNKSKQIRIAHFLNKKVVTESYISFYDTEVNEKKRLQSDSLRAKKYKSYDKLIIEYGRPVIFLNKSEEAYHSEVAGTKAKSSAIVPLCIPYRDKATLPYANSQSNVLNVCWWGSFIPLHGLDIIIKSAKELSALDVPFRMHLFGRANGKKGKYEDLISSLNLSDKVILYTDQSFGNGQLQKFLINNCDIALGIFGASRKAKTVFANKMGDALSFGLPLLTQKTIALDEMCNISEELYSIENPTPKSLAEAIANISKNRNDMKLRGHNGYIRYKSTFSKEVFYTNLDKIFKG